MLADLRLALRTLARRPGFTALAVLTLGIGLGAGNVVFAVVDTVVLRPLPFPRPERLVQVGPTTSVSKEELVFLRSQAQSYDAVAAYWGWSSRTLTGEGEPEAIPTAEVSPGYFALLGVAPRLGRGFSPADEAPGGALPVVFSERLWQRRFAADPQVIGRTIRLSGRPRTVVGVMPAGFQHPHNDTELWVPLVVDPADAGDYTASYLTVLGRLGAGASLDAARAEGETLTAALAEARGSDEGLRQLYAPQGLRQVTIGSVRPMLLILLSAVGFLLLIVAANLANLFLLRGLGRSREVAVRLALGAGRARLARLLLAESLLVTAAGGALGLVAAAWGLEALVAHLPAGTPRLSEIGLDGRLLALSIAGTLAVGLVAGLAPALRAVAPDLRGSLAGGPRSGTGGEVSRLGSSLVVAEVALAFVLVVGAGLALQSFWRLLAVDPGFSGERVLALRPQPSSADYPTYDRRREYVRQVAERIAALPGVESVGGIHMLPVHNQGFNGRLDVEGQPVEPGVERPLVNWRVVTPGYFATLEIPVLAGRNLDHTDREGAPQVVLVNRTLAERLWPGESALGRRLEIGLEDTGWLTVVGVVGDIRQHGLDLEPLPEIYRPVAQNRRPVGMVLVARTAGEPAALIPTVREAVWAVDPNVPTGEVRTLAQVVSLSVAEPRLLLALLTGFAAVALFLGAVGIYGAISQEVRRRTHEIGVRVALGAGRGDVLRLTLARGALMFLAGAALGLAGSAALGRLLASRLYGVEPGDPAILAAVTAVLAATAAAAAALPARRAVAVDPVEALRAD